MKYYKIESDEDYYVCCNQLLEVTHALAKSDENSDLKAQHYVLSLIIKDYERNQKNPFSDLTPVDLLVALMQENELTAYKLSKELGIQQSILSEITKYKRGFSKALIRKLSQRFNIGQDSFMKEYELTGKKEAA